MQVIVELPDDLAGHVDGAREALEAFAIAGFRSGAFGSFQLQQLLGLQNRFEVDGFLKLRDIWEQSYGVDDLEEDRKTLASLPWS